MQYFPVFTLLILAGGFCLVKSGQRETLVAMAISFLVGYQVITDNLTNQLWPMGFIPLAAGGFLFFWWFGQRQDIVDYDICNPGFKFTGAALTVIVGILGLYWYGQTTFRLVEFTAAIAAGVLWASCFSLKIARYNRKRNKREVIVMRDGIFPSPEEEGVIQC